MIITDAADSGPSSPDKRISNVTKASPGVPAGDRPGDIGRSRMQIMNRISQIAGSEG